MVSSKGSLESKTTIAVINLVIDAIGRLTEGFFSKYTSLVSWFTTMTTLDLRLSSSCCPRKPNAVASDGRVGTTGSDGRVTVTRTVFGFLADLLAVLTTTILVVLACFSLSLLAATAGALIKALYANSKVKTKSQKRFKRIPKYLPKLSTYRMIISFPDRDRFICPTLMNSLY